MTVEAPVPPRDTLSPVRRDRLSDRVYDEIRSRILSGELPPGARLTESEIARRLQLSQSPVRDAFKRLANEGLITQEPRRGSFVAAMDEDEARRIAATRRLLEPYAALEFLRWGGGAAIERLAGFVEAMERAAADDDLQLLVDSDIGFHRTLYEDSQHPVLPRVWPAVEKSMRTFTPSSNRRNYPSLAEIASTHRPLLEALQSGDESQVEACFRDHVDDVWRRIDASRSASEAH